MELVKPIYFRVISRPFKIQRAKTRFGQVLLAPKARKCFSKIAKKLISFNISLQLTSTNVDCLEVRFPDGWGMYIRHGFCCIHVRIAHRMHDPVLQQTAFGWLLAAKRRDIPRDMRNYLLKFILPM